MLTGKYKSTYEVPPDSRAADPKANSFIGRYLRTELLDKVGELGVLAGELGITTAQLSLAWILRQKNVASALVGATRPEQIEQNAAASGISLSAETLARIEQIMDKDI